MSEESPADALVIAIRVADPILAERVAGLLSDVPGLRLADAGEAADLAVVTATPVESES